MKYQYPVAILIITILFIYTCSKRNYCSLTLFSYETSLSYFMDNNMKIAYKNILWYTTWLGYLFTITYYIIGTQRKWIKFIKLCQISIGMVLYNINHNLLNNLYFSCNK